MARRMNRKERRFEELARWASAAAELGREMEAALLGGDMAQAAGLMCLDGSVVAAVEALRRLMAKEGSRIEPREDVWRSEADWWNDLPMALRIGLSEGRRSAKACFSAMLALVDALPADFPKLPHWIAAVEATVKPADMDSARALLRMAEARRLGPRAWAAWTAALEKAIAEGETREIGEACGPGSDVGGGAGRL